MGGRFLFVGLGLVGLLHVGIGILKGIQWLEYF